MLLNLQYLFPIFFKSITKSKATSQKYQYHRPGHKPTHKEVVGPSKKPSGIDLLNGHVKLPSKMYP